MLFNNLDNRKELEAIIDVAVIAGVLIGSKGIEVEDSRDLIDASLEIAEAFEEQLRGYDYNEQTGEEPFRSYLMEIDNYATKELLKRFPHPNTITLTTYKAYDETATEDNSENSRDFVVPIDWARKQVAKVFNKSLEEFLDTYTWDDTMGWVEEASDDGVLISVLSTDHLEVMNAEIDKETKGIREGGK